MVSGKASSPNDIGWKELDKQKFFAFGTMVFFGVRTALYPTVVVKTRLQVARTEAQMKPGSRVTFRMVDFFKSIYRNEGFRGFYKGFGTIAFGIIPAQIVYLSGYEVTKEKVGLALNGTFHPSVVDAIRNFIAGGVASMASQVVSVPIDVIASRLMVQSPTTDTAVAYNYRGGMDAFSKIIRQDGVKGLFRGYWASAATYIPSSAVWWATYDSSRKVWGSVLEKINPEWELLPQLLSGATAGITAATATTPLDVAKTRLQVMTQSYLNTSVHGVDGSQHSRIGMYGTLKALVREEGYRALYRGLSARCLSMVPMSMTMVVSYEFVKQQSATNLSKNE